MDSDALPGPAPQPGGSSSATELRGKTGSAASRTNCEERRTIRAQSVRSLPLPEKMAERQHDPREQRCVKPCQSSHRQFSVMDSIWSLPCKQQLRQHHKSQGERGGSLVLIWTGGMGGVNWMTRGATSKPELGLPQPRPTASRSNDATRSATILSFSFCLRW